MSHDASMYGAQRSLLTLLSGIDRSVITPLLLNPDDGSMGRKAAGLGIPVFVKPLVHWIPGTWVLSSRKRRLKHCLGFFGSLNLRCRAIERLIDEQEADLVYTNTITCVEGAIAAKRTRKPHIWHIRESISGNSELVPFLPGRFYCEAVAALSKSVIFNSRVLANDYPRLSGKAHVVHNGFPLPSLPDRAAARADVAGGLGIGNGAKLVAIVGAMHPRKDLFTFLDAAERVARSVEEAVFLIVGTGSEQYNKQVLRRISDLKLESKVMLTGWRDDIDHIMAAIDVLVISSEQESFGRTMIEALAVETPVVATRCGGPDEILADGETGILVPVKDPRSLAGAVTRVLQDPELAHRLGARGRTHVRERLGVDQYVRGVQRVILETADSVSGTS